MNPNLFCFLIFSIVSIFVNEIHCAKNVVLLIADDMGFENLLMNKGENPNPQSEFPSTPNLDSLAAQGIRFTHAFSEPVCSSTRATLLTGKHPFRHGIGNVYKFKFNFI